VQRLVKERCDVRVRLPVAGHVASLNASAAAAALLYEVVRQRAAKTHT
jgi:23S rRNA (guanosine2251-2'-O)-methyltransferase